MLVLVKQATSECIHNLHYEVLFSTKLENKTAVHVCLARAAQTLICIRHLLRKYQAEERGRGKQERVQEEDTHHFTVHHFILTCLGLVLTA